MGEEHSSNTADSRPAAGKAAKRQPAKRRSIRRRLLGSLFYLLYLLLIAELCARAYLSASSGTSFFEPERFYQRRYEKLAAVERRLEAGEGEQGLRVLLLGASALNPEWGAVEQELRKQLAAALPGGKEVVIFNVAEKAHTSLDSFYKYRHLQEHRFDLVVLYHGINDVRMAYAPPEEFRDDYSHYAWYGALNIFERNRRFRYFSLVYAAPIALLDLRQKFGYRFVMQADLSLVERQERDYPPLTARGSRAFKKHLRAIAELAGKKGDRLVLLTFANFVPPDYSLEAFKAKALDYGKHLSPIEIWGSVGAVTKGIAANNRAVRELAEEFPAALFVDLENLMPKSGGYFDDICHLTERGSALFAEKLSAAFMRRLDHGVNSSADVEVADDTHAARRE